MRSDGSAAASRNVSLGNNATVETSRREVSRVFAMAAANGSLSSDNRTYLARAVAARASLSQADAEKRVDAIFALVKTAADKTREATETARKAGIILALSVAAGAIRLALASITWRGAMQARQRLIAGQRKRRVRKSRAFC